MFLRALFLLLLALNIGSVAWLLFGRSAPAPTAAPSDAGVAALVLLSERDGDAGNAELATAPETAEELADDRCRTLGPFPTQADMHAAMAALTPSTKRIRQRETRTTQARGYWVYLEAMPTREQALATARNLSGKGVRDYYVVTAGEQQNTISLGLFRDPGNAGRRSAEITALGFSPKTQVRSEEVPAYWLDYALLDGAAPTWRELVARPADLEEQEIPCR